MDVDFKEKPRKLTLEEQERCFKEGCCLHCRQKGHMAASCTTFMNPPPLPTCSSAHPLTRKVAIVETTASVEEIAKEDEDRVIGQLSTPQEKYNQDF